MKIVIHFEGGPEGERSSGRKRILRLGVQALLQPECDAARSKRGAVEVIPHGKRRAAYEHFVDAVARSSSERVDVLLVDSESPMPPFSAKSDSKLRVRHLREREGDKWELSGASADGVHLMVQCMETWIVADPDALASFYGKGFHPNALPTRTNLEDEPKEHVYDKLKKATRNSKRGQYKKLDHASELLPKLDREKVRARCPRFAAFIDWMQSEIESWSSSPRPHR